MVKKAQVTIYVVIGLIFVLVLAYFFYMQEQIQDETYSNSIDAIYTSQVNVDTKSYVRNCIDQTLTKYMADTGLSQETLSEYENYIEQGVPECTESLFNALRLQNYEITSGEVDATVELNDETIVVDIVYPVILVKDKTKVEYKSFLETFKKTTWVDIPGGIVQEDSIIFSTDKRAYLLLPKGTELRDVDNNPVERIAIKVKDKHDNGRNNGVVIGNLIFEGLPDGLIFSQPVEMSIEIRPEDIPEGRSISEIAFVQYDEDHYMWRGQPTRIEGNRVVGRIKHFTDDAAGLCQINYVLPPHQNTYDVVFIHPFGSPSNRYSANPDFLISEESESIGASHKQDYYLNNFGLYDVAPIEYGKTEFVEVTEGYGFFKFVNALDIPDCVDESRHFSLHVGGEPILQCEKCIQESDYVDCDFETHNPCGDNSIWKSLGMQDFVNGATLITESKQVCECVPKIKGEEKSFGYCNKEIVGGRRVGSTTSPIHCFEIASNGDGCGMEGPDGVTIVNVRAVFPTGDVCYFRNVPGTVRTYFERPNDAEQKTEICIIGVNYLNTNGDAEARCSVFMKYQEDIMYNTHLKKWR